MNIALAHAAAWTIALIAFPSVPLLAVPWALSIVGSYIVAWKAFRDVPQI